MPPTREKCGARYSGFLRNVAIAMGNSEDRGLMAPLERLARSADEVVARHARWDIEKLKGEA